MDMKNVAVVGIGQTEFKTHHADTPFDELVQQATLRALRDAGLSADDVDAVVFSMAPTQFMGVNDADRWALDAIGMAGKPVMRVHTGGATGGSAFQAAYAHVASGSYRSVLIVGGDRIAETPDAQHILNLIWDRLYEKDFGLNTVTMLAFAAQRYMAKYGATEEQYASVVVEARRKAKLNRYAHLKGDLSVDNVMSSPRIAWPFKRYDICPRSSGAAAMVICDEETARKSSKTRPAWVQGASALTHSGFLGDRMTYWAETEFGDLDGLNRAAQDCYRQGGVTDPARQIQVAEMYDAFSSMMFPQLESLGFCNRGQAAEAHGDGAFARDSGLVCANPSGGTLCTNPIGVTALVRVADAARQVMGEAGEMQLPNVDRAVATGIGGSTQFFTCTLLGADQR